MVLVTDDGARIIHVRYKKKSETESQNTKFQSYLLHAFKELPLHYILMSNK